MFQDKVPQWSKAREVTYRKIFKLLNCYKKVSLLKVFEACMCSDLTESFRKKGVKACMCSNLRVTYSKELNL